MGVQTTYRARAIDWDFGYSRNDIEQVAVRYQVTEGTNEGATFTWYGFFNTADNSKRALEALRRSGWTGDDVTDLQGLGDSEVEIVVEEEIYQGKKRLKVAWVNEIGAGPVLSRKMNDAQKRAFAARMRGLAAQIKSKSSSSTPAYPPEWDKP